MTYGVVAVLLGLMLIVIVGLYYDLEVLTYPVAIGVLLSAVFVGGILVWRRRRRRHGKAFARELGGEEKSSPQR